MRSPFAIFRKHQRGLMVVLTGASMFLFVVADSLRAEHSPLVMPLLFGMFGAALFAVLGWRSGEATKYAVVGTVIGLVGGWFVPSGHTTKAPVQTQLGDISREEMMSLVNRRHTANAFMRLAFEKVVPPMEGNPMLQQWWEQQLNQRMFGFMVRDEREDITDDVILGYLLDKEADDLGIAVSDDTVSDYINRMTDKRLTQAQFAAALKTLNVTESQLFNDIRGELRAKLAMEMLIPRTMPTPDQYWENYRKMSVTQRADVAAVAVADFVAQAPEPTKEKLTQYFDTWKEIAPAFPGAPGLRQPRRVRIEYLQADYNEMEKEAAAPPITDAEVKKYYDDHREEYRVRPASTSTPKRPAAKSSGATAAPKASGTKPAAGPELTLPAPSNSSGSKSAPPKSTPSTDKKSGKDSPKSQPSSDRRNLGTANGELLALATPGDSTNDDSPILLADAQKKPSAAAATSSGSATNKSGKTATHPKPTLGGEPDAPPLPEGSTGETTNPFAGATGEPEAEFKPLDEILRREIRDEILRNRTHDLMKSKIQAAYDFMASLHEKVIPEPGAKPALDAAAREKTLRAYAAANHLTYVLTPLLSVQELYESEKYPIGKAAEPVEDPFQRRQPITVMQELFMGPPDVLFQPYQADDRDTHRFTYWKVEDVAEHVPTLDEPGVREQAVRDWKVIEYAQKKAKERADELAELTRKSKKPMSEALSGQKVTKKGPAVVVVPTPPFSWISVQSAAPEGLQSDPQPRLSEIAGVKDPDDVFMKTVFDDMQVGDIRVVPNRGQQILYLVKVTSRHPATEEELAGFRARFMKENFFGGGFLQGGRSTYDYLSLPEENQITMEWAHRLYLKYNVKRNLEEEVRPPRPAAAG